MKKILFNTSFILCLCLSDISWAKPIKLVGDPNDDVLYLSVLREVVHRSDIYTSLEYVYDNSSRPSESRLAKDLSSGKLDLIWSATNDELERQFVAIPYPIYRGLLGFRIGLVRKSEPDVLQYVEDLADLKHLPICSGSAWPDTRILESNGLLVAKALKYPNLFRMLAAGNRCDVYMRGVMEPFEELSRFSFLPLAVDKHVLLKYRMPSFFFARKGNKKLASHIGSIIENMYADGTYNDLFFSAGEIKQSLDKANLNKRVIFELDTPTITTATKSIPRDWWYEPPLND